MATFLRILLSVAIFCVAGLLLAVNIVCYKAVFKPVDHDGDNVFGEYVFKILCFLVGTMALAASILSYIYGYGYCTDNGELIRQVNSLFSTSTMLH